MAKNTICVWYDKEAERLPASMPRLFPIAPWVPLFAHREIILTASKETYWSWNSPLRAFLASA
uniref:Uncharacterized protein n=1 Tax=Rhizobium leguminosarum bv. trifolii TaxID=386 RepID=A0A1C9I163_RHILT|nr:hypothetical protein [Rhizobium leguminosarum bv. trifolii]